MAEFNPHILRPHLRRKESNLSDEQQYGPDGRWLVYGNSITGYERTFSRLFSGQKNPIRDFEQQRRLEKKPLIALDIMSGTHALRSLLPDRGLVLALTDQRDGAEQKFDQRYIDVIPGDALDDRVWRQAVDWLQQYGGNEAAFHLILERGEGALENIPHDSKLLYRLIENLYQVLSRDDGMMLLQLPPQTHQILQQWIQQLDVVAGLTVVYSLKEMLANKEVNAHYPTLKLIKHATAPDALPPLTE